ncbi:MAG: type II toxin-antitoxin system HigB family toxin [Bacteroidota bacterium]
MKLAFEKFKDRIDMCDWSSPSDIMKSFRTADTITCIGKPFTRIVFNIGGNKYRMICGYKFGKNRVVLYIRFIGTHEAYDNINPCEVNMF